METLFIGRNRIRLKAVASTNNYASELIRQHGISEGTLITAESQTAGRGQRLRPWHSQPGANILCTYVLQPRFLTINQQFLLNKAVALAVLDVVETLCPGSFLRIKWPNDILLEGRKLAGILLENTLQAGQIVRSLAGIGLNVNQTAFPPDLPFAHSLARELGTTLPLDSVQDRLSVQLEKYYLRLRRAEFSAIESAYDQHLFGIHQWVNFPETGPLQILGCDTLGQLRTRNTQQLEQRWQHGQLTWNLGIEPTSHP